MNKQAEKHLAKAKDYVARGEDFYRKAAEEIIAAQKAEPTLTLREVDRRMSWYPGKAGHIVRWLTSGADHAPHGGPRQDEAQTKSRTRKMLREAPPEQIAELLAEPEIRQNVGRALDQHYAKQAKASSQRQHSREVERKGGEEEYEDHQYRQHLAEVINVARGATSGWRFVAGQAKNVELDSGALETLVQLVEETEGYISLLKTLLRGDEITDEAIAELIGEQT